MVRLFKTLLLWLMVLAVPAQGAASATMVFCGPNHHSANAGADVHREVPADHAHHHGDTATDHQHATTTTSADEGGSVAASSNHISQHKCSVCAACCSVSAMLGSVLSVPTPVFAPTVFSVAVFSVDPFVADGPDRPPRWSIA